MTAVIVSKLLVTVLALLFIVLPSKPSSLWFIFSFVLSIVFILHIPSERRISLFMLVPVLFTIAGLQLISGYLANTIHIQIIVTTSLKILFTACVVIGARFFIGREALKVLASRVPFSAGLFFLIFARTIALFAFLNRMIVFQLQSRLNIKSFEKYYIPKYYITALLFNQFHAVHRYQTGILSRSFTEIPEVEIFTEISFKERTTIFAVIIIITIFIIVST